MIKILLKSFILIATLLYAVLFVYSLISPQKIEQQARGFIKEKIEEKTHEKIDNLSEKYKDNTLIKLSQKIFKAKNEKLKAYKLTLQGHLDNKLADTMNTMPQMSIEARKKYTNNIKKILTFKITILSQAKEKLQKFMRHKYMFILQNIISDFKIFAGSNFLIMFILLILVNTKPKENEKTLFLAGFMFLFTLLSTYLYIFDQNWFLTIIYNDFLGYIYLGYLGIIFFFLIDIIFNKARILDIVLNAIGNAINGVISSIHI